MRGVGVLRLVDQDVVELAVELVADPLRQALVAEQCGGAADLVVEVDQPFALLGRVPRQREATPDGQRRDQQLDKVEQRTAIEHLLRLR